MTSPAADTHRRFRRASWIGGAAGTLLFAWMVTAGTFDLFRWQLLGDFYDAQAHAFLAGDLAIDKEVLGIEGFLGRGGETYMYQGPVPALLRLPVLALTDHRLDARLTQSSMILAVALTAVVLARLHWTVRELVRPGASLSRLEAWMVGCFAFAVTGGSILLYEASRAWVYHEALCWGVALCLATLERFVAFLRRPSAGALAACSALATATVLTRASVGLGPIGGLVLVAVGLAAARLWRARAVPGWLAWLSPAAGDAPPPWAAFAAALAPLVAYAAVNLAKFEQLFSIPFAGQRFTVVDPGRQQMLAENHGTLFGLQFAPTTVQHYFRPDRVRFTGLFPFVDFPPFPGPLVGDVTFDLVDRAVSLPVAAPVLLLPALAGLWWAFHPGSWPEQRWRPLRLPLLAAAAAGLSVLPFGFIANRYLGDFVPVLVLAGAVGLQAAWSRLEAPGRGRARRAGAGALVALALWSLWVNAGLALRYQRQWSSNIDHATLAGFLGLQHDVDRRLGGGGLPEPERVGAGEALPPGVGRVGSLAVAGDCDALYLSDGMAVNSLKVTPWNGVERRETGGHHRFSVTIRRRSAGTVEPIFTAGTSEQPYGLVLVHLGGGRVRLEYRAAVGADRVDRPFPAAYGEPRELDLVADWRVDRLSVRVGDITAMENFFGFRGPLAFGTNQVFADAEATFSGTLRRLPVATPLCERILAAGEGPDRR